MNATPEIKGRSAPNLQDHRRRPLDETQLRAFLSHTLDPKAGCMEMRIFGATWQKSGFITAGTQYSLTYNGYFDNADSLHLAAGRVKDVSAYVTINPCLSELMAREGSNKLTKCRKGAGTLDTQIPVVRWLYIDFDADRPSDISSTNEELERTIERRIAVLAKYPELAASAIWGCSGNGQWVLVKIKDLPANPETTELIHRALKIIAAEFSGDGVTVDAKTRNPARVMCLPGTWKCKGSDRLDRPWRMVTIESEQGEREPIDLLAWVEDHEPQTPAGLGDAGTATQAPVGSHSNGNGVDLDKRIRAFMDSVVRAGKDSKTFDIAIGLRRGYSLSRSEARRYLDIYNATGPNPRSDGELEHKLDDAEKRSIRRPDGWLLSESYSNGHAASFTYSGPIDVTGFANNGTPPATSTQKRRETEQPNRLPTIELRNAGLNEVVDKSLLAVGCKNQPPTIFNRGGNLCRVKELDEKSLRIEGMTADSMLDVMSASAVYQQTRETEHGEVSIEVFPPKQAAKSLLARPAWDIAAFPHLDGIAETPRFAPDGRLVAAYGYDAGSRLYMHLSPEMQGLEIPSNPEDGDVERAKDLILNNMLLDFPFDSQASKANAVALAILPFVRPMIPGPTPFHVCESSTQGTGKSKAIKACLYPAHGEVAATPHHDSNVETEKTLTTFFLEGKNVIYIDNMDDPIGQRGESKPIDSKALAAALTEPRWNARILGASTAIDVRITSIFVGTGNNLTFSRDLRRRIAPIRLLTMMEKPEERSGFKHPNLERWIKENRRDLVWACLVLCQRWIASGRPPGKAVWGSYEEYVSTVGGILETVGIPGFIKNLSRAAIADSESARWTQFVKKWAEQGGVTDKAGHLFKDLIQDDSDLLEAFGFLISSDPDKREDSINSCRMKFGHLLKKQVEKVRGDFRIEQTGQVGGSPLYSLTSLRNCSDEPR